MIERTYQHPLRNFNETPIFLAVKATHSLALLIVVTVEQTWHTFLQITGRQGPLREEGKTCASSSTHSETIRIGLTGAERRPTRQAGSNT